MEIYETQAELSSEPNARITDSDISHKATACVATPCKFSAPVLFY